MAVIAMCLFCFGCGTSYEVATYVPDAGPETGQQRPLEASTEADVDQAGSGGGSATGCIGCPSAGGDRNPGGRYK